MHSHYYFFFSLLLCIQACSSITNNSSETNSNIEEPQIAYTINAIGDFNSISVAGFPKAYIDENRKAIALNAVEYKGVYTAVNYIFDGESNKYDLHLNTLCELDGESNYRVAINGKLLNGTKTNPIIFGTDQSDYTPASHTWKRVELSKGDTIRIEASSETNGKVPEGDITAYSRGRFTSIVLQKTK